MTATRGAKVWVLECAELGAVSQVARLDQVEAGREAAKAANRRASQSAQVAARVLLDYGLSLRDAGVVMGLSHQRVAQLAG